MYQDDTNYEPLTPEQIRALQQLTPDQQQEWRDRQIEQLNREIYQSGETAAIATDVLKAKPDPLREKAERELQKDILSALKDSQFPRAALAQIARYSAIPLEIVETVADQMASNFLGRDLERLEFESMSKRIQSIEAKEKDPGIRDWKLQKLARRYKTTTRQMMDCFNKALCQQQLHKPKTVSEFRAEHEGDHEWLVPGWIAQGTTLLLHADGGVGKTLFAYQLMESVLQGKPWQGYPVDKGSVLLVQVDEPALVTSERIDVRGIRDDDPLYILSDWQADSIDGLEAHIAEIKPSLLIVDSLTAINRRSLFSENDTEYARPLLQLAALGNTYGCTVLIIHHSNAQGKSRGSTAIRNSVSEVWGLSIVAGTERQLHVEKTRLGRPPGYFRFAFNEDDFSFHYLGEQRGDDIEDTRTQEERVRLWLSESCGVAYASVEVSELMGIPKDSARRVCAELWAKRLIRRKRPPGSRSYLYYFAPDTKLCSDHESDQVIAEMITSSDHTLPAQGMALSASDQVITKKTKTNTCEKSKNDDHFDHLITSSVEPQNPPGMQPLATVLLSDSTVITCDDHLITSDRSFVKNGVEVGDTVLLPATANWIRSGSDKLPWQEVPKSQRSTPQIPLNVLGQPLFDELMDGGKVIEIRGDRARVRNQKTGRTSMFLLTDLRVLRSEGES